MSSLFLAAGALFIAWIVHLAIWRWRLPKAQLKTLLVIFALVWAVASLSVLLGVAGAGSFAPGSLVGFLYFCLIYWSAALCYVITYSAMEGDSPTLSLTRHLHAKGAEGVLHEEIEEFFRQRPFVGARVKALVTDNIFIEERGGYRLASGKYLFFRLILGYRKVVFGPVKAGG
jgi:predicted neutral ceramidase superfamily lipid hydrolase